MSGLDTEPYKGVRVFYPEEMWEQEYIFDTWSHVAEFFGYEKYTASILEPAELYRAKTGEEIVNEQTYTFTDRGDREVTLRPEMTPTVARMIAARRRELTLPARWYSIPNLFRYERPQRGRLREHWQLNCDIIGAPDTAADVEIVLLANALMRGFGADESHFDIHINHMGIFKEACSALGIKEDVEHDLRKLLDKRRKIDDFDAQLQELAGITAAAFDEALATADENSVLPSITQSIKDSGITNVTVDHSIVRGMDYYTGVVFEIFDTSPENNRAMFGGGRYDNLTELFGNESVPAVGFGMGDVTMRDFLIAHDLMPKRPAYNDLFIATLETRFIPHAQKLAHELRSEGLRVIVNVTDKKVGDQIQFTDRKGIPFVIVIGEDELSSETMKLKNMDTGEEVAVRKDEIRSHIEK